MKTRLLIFSAVFALAGCECGPGVACKTNSDCGDEAHCETLGGSSGYCVASRLADSGAPDSGVDSGFDAGVDAGDGGFDAGFDAGAPKASIPAALIDFGLVGC